MYSIRSNPKIPIDIRQLGLVDYKSAYKLQKDIVNQLKCNSNQPDTLLLLEHPSVYTAGSKANSNDQLDEKIKLISVDRGGKITWHGPGQLVGYPIIKLACPIDVIKYVRCLEQALIFTCSELGLNCIRIKNRSGVWLPSTKTLPTRKIGAIGIKISKNITYHGFSLNCNPDLSYFSNIIPCGIRDAGVTSLAKELNQNITTLDIINLVANNIVKVLNHTDLYAQKVNR